MTLEDAKQQALSGSNFGVIYPALDNEDVRRLFKAWWLYDSRLPIYRLSSQEAGLLRVKTAQSSGMTVESGNGCTICGGLMIWTGRCQTCNSCGNSPGGCS
jgi:hypothetical protein